MRIQRFCRRAAARRWVWVLKKDYFFLLALSFAGLKGLNYVCSLAAGPLFSNSLLSAAALAVIFAMLRGCAAKLRRVEDRRELRRRALYGGTAAYVLSLSLVMGSQLRFHAMTDSGFRGKAWLLLQALALSAVVFPVTYALFDGLCRRREGRPVEESAGEQGRWSGRKIFFCSWGFIFLCFIPVFLAYYPSVMAYDFNIQSIQAQGTPDGFNSHHPLAHTWLLWVAFHIGRACGSMETGMACYSLFQMLVLSGALAYSCAMIYRLCRSRWALALALLFYGIFPYCSVLAVSVTKDVIFAALFLIFVLFLVERFYFRWGGGWLDVVILLEGSLMTVFRNNAVYAMVVFGLCWAALAPKKEKLRALLVGVCLVLGGSLLTAGIKLACGAWQEGSDAEKYSVPMQQFARVGHYHGEALDPESAALLERFVVRSAWQDYNPSIADTVKIQVTNLNFKEAWEGHMSDVWKAWAVFGKRYPNEFLDAFLCLTAGYWSLCDVTWAENLGVGLEERKGALFTFNASESYFFPEGIANESKLPGLERALEEIVSNNSFYRWPVLSNLFKPALYCWALALSALSFCFLRSRRGLLIALCPLCYLGTLLLGPVVNVRYVFPVIVVVPVLGALLFRREEL